MTNFDISKLSINLTSLMEQHNLSERGLAKESGIPQTQINRIRLQKVANPGVDTIKKLINYFNISLEQLLGEEPLPLTKNKRIPLILTPVLDIEHVTNWMQNKQHKSFFRNYLKIECDASQGDLFAVLISTKAFEPLITKGSLVIFNSSSKLRDGDIVLAKNSDNLSLGHCFFESGNVYFKPILLGAEKTLELQDTNQIIAPVVEIRYSFRADSLETITIVEESNEQGFILEGQANVFC